MALTDIARQLKETFEGFGGAEHRDELKQYREIYGDAECVQIGEMDYIVINDVYKSKEYADVPESTSPLFFNSINNSYAIIDAETSSTLIDEVYSRVTYMQRVCRVDTAPDKEEIRRSLRDLIGKGITLSDVLIKSESTDSNKANIFQCQLIKDTGVSAVPDVYSFVLKNGEIKEIAENIMRQIRRSGEVNLLKDRNVLEENKAAIQQAVFDKYINSDVDIQGITVKSIFEISMTFLNIHVMLTDEAKRRGVFNTSYLASENNEFEALNANIHVCNCGHELVDVKDPSKIYRLHVNTDAYDEEFSTENQRVHAVGCEDCLVKCEECGGWHFNYEKFIGSDYYDKVKLMPGRGFIKGLRTIDVNYCSCREGIEWIYDERTGSEEEHDVIPLKKMAFINYANEQIASYDDYMAYYEKRRGNKKMDALEEVKLAKRVRADFKKHLASKFDIDVKDIRISSSDKCMTCSICGGNYYRGTVASDYDDIYRCEICDELISEKRSSVTRIDGIVFMNHKVKNRSVISKYIVTKFGNLKKLSSSFLEIEPSVEPQEAPVEAEVEPEEQVAEN
ncbi:MAG: hypothetical protein E7663_02825 [Ruminococcaceae bacterium]|nr:hypothetical protein [Oscillospiraceae bacterium]